MQIWNMSTEKRLEILRDRINRIIELVPLNVESLSD